MVQTEKGSYTPVNPPRAQWPNPSDRETEHPRVAYNVQNERFLFQRETGM